MNRRTRALLQLALRCAPASRRQRLKQQWTADLAEVDAYGIGPLRYALGLLAAAIRIRVVSRQRPHRSHLAASLTVVALMGAAVPLARFALQPDACSTPNQILAVVAGTDQSAGTDHVGARTNAAIRAISEAGGYEGSWIEPDGSFHIGVYGPAWDEARTHATAIEAIQGPEVTYVCKPVTEKQLRTTQQALDRSPLWKQGLIGFSDIDARTATVTVGLADTAPATTEAELERTYGSRLAVVRSRDPFVDMQPATGRMPIAQSLKPPSPS